MLFRTGYVLILYSLMEIKGNTTEYYHIIIDKVKPGGFIIADNVLWGGKVLDNNTGDPQTIGIIEFNEMIKHRKILRM